jgi:hypothetical protein
VRSALRAAAHVAVEARPARQRVRWTHAWPVVLRPTGPDGGGDRVHLVPTVVSDGAVLESTLRVELAAGATAQVREVVVLGRHGQRGGRCTSVLEVVVGGVPLLVHTTLLDGADAGLCGPAGTAGARAVGTLVCAGHGAAPAPSAGEAPGVRWAWSALDGPGAVLPAVGAPAAVTAVLAAADVVVPATAPDATFVRA